MAIRIEKGRCYLAEIYDSRIIVRIDNVNPDPEPDFCGHGGKVLWANQDALSESWDNDANIPYIDPSEFVCETPGIVVSYRIITYERNRCSKGPRMFPSTP
jgi:hypothetical protein